MRRLAVLLAAWALVLCMGMGSVAHAMEPIGCIDIKTEAMAGHTDGDGDQAMGDSDKATPHHHGGCYGHHLFTAPDAYSVPVHLLTAALIPPAPFTGQPRGAARPALRPPIS